MNGKHTPGPWVVGQSGGVIDRRGCAVAKVEDMPGQDSGERAANARLISAAPDMLEALRNLVADWERVQGRPIPDDHEAKIVITRAEGGAR